MIDAETLKCNVAAVSAVGGVRRSSFVVRRSSFVVRRCALSSLSLLLSLLRRRPSVVVRRSSSVRRPSFVVRPSSVRRPSFFNSSVTDERSPIESELNTFGIDEAVQTLLLLE